MTKRKFILFFKILAVIQYAECGNFVECPQDYCNQNDGVLGQCILMSSSPSPLTHLESRQSGRRAASEVTSVRFEVSAAPMSFYEARKFCRSKSSDLFVPKSVKDFDEAKTFLLEQSVFDKITGVWSGGDQQQGQCQALFLPEFVPDLQECHVNHVFFALCQESVAPEFAQAEDIGRDFMYTCQCQHLFGFENCTNADSNNGGTSYCHNSTATESFSMTSDSDDYVLIVDHAVYGKPFYMEGSFSDGIGGIGGGAKRNCPSNLYADLPDEYCVAANTLAALIYWCQGKRRCTVPFDYLTDVGDYKDFFVMEHFDSSFESAEGSCSSKNGHIARPLTVEHFRQIQVEMAGRRTLPIAKDSTKIRWFWIDPRVAQDTNVEIIWNGEDRGHCLVMSNHFGNPYLGAEYSSSHFLVNLQRVPCQDPGIRIDGDICEASFGATKTGGVTPKENDPLDQTCLRDVDTKVMEFRYRSAIIDASQVYCPMDVDSREGYNCYKYTEPMTWREARRQCWHWGGDLAFPLNPESDFCSKSIYRENEEDVWIANNQGCSTFRCIVPFSSTSDFTEGTYSPSMDLCLEDAAVEPDPMVLKPGLCALAVAEKPRTHFPVEHNCPIVDPNSPDWPDWPFGDYGWNVEGIPGQVSTQECPRGQNGMASWRCSAAGEWIGLPDLSSCRSLDITDTINELNNETSVPSEVVDRFHQEIAEEQELASGDIDQVLQVVDRAIWAQNNRLPLQEDQENYADKFTRETIDLLDDILGRPISWVGIVPEEKRQTLTKIQNNVDDISNSLLQYASEEHDYRSTNDELKVKVVPSVDVGREQEYQDGESSIVVIAEDSSFKSIGFQSFASFGCLLAGRSDCEREKLCNDTTMDLVNSVVLGATLFDANRNVIRATDSVTVTLNFKYNCDGDTYNITNAACGFWDVDTSLWSEEGCELNDPSNTSTQCICNHLTNFGVILDVNGNLVGKKINELLTWITIVGCTLSIISLLMCLYVFTFVRGLRGERTTIHRNLCLSLVLAEILLLGGLDATSNPALCGTIAGMLHFLFLSVFAWMLVEGVHVYYMLVKVFDTARSPLWIYYLVGYVAPAGIVILCVIIVESTGTHGYGNPEYCWLEHENGLIWAFAGPVLAIIVFNTFMFAKALLIARKTMRKKHSSEDKKQTLTLLKGSFSLLCILGLTWVFGFTYFADGAEWLAVIFAILNSFQGVFILLFHVLLNDKARLEVKKSLRKTFRKTTAFVTRQPYESTTAFSDASKSQAKFYNGSSSAVTISTEAKTVSSSTVIDKEPSSAATIEKQSEMPNTNPEDQSYYRGQMTMKVVDSKSRTPSPVNNDERDIAIKSTDKCERDDGKEEDLANSESEI